MMTMTVFMSYGNPLQYRLTKPNLTLLKYLFSSPTGLPKLSKAMYFLKLVSEIFKKLPKFTKNQFRDRQSTQVSELCFSFASTVKAA
jgi:hypothetical protein